MLRRTASVVAGDGIVMLGPIPVPQVGQVSA